jgi:hypothetical protein
MTPQSQSQNPTLHTVASVETAPSLGLQPPDAAQIEPKPFLCRRPVRMTIYILFAILFLLMLAWRYVPILLDPTFEKHIADKRVMVGMSRQQVMQACGSPYSMNVSYTKDGIRREEWVYEDWESAAIVKHRYLYFEEDNLIGGWYYSSSPTPKSGSPQKFHDEKALNEISQ